MKNLKIPIGFKALGPALRQSAIQTKLSMGGKVTAAIKIAALVLVKIDNKEIEGVLNLPASLKEDGFLSRVYSHEEMPKLSLLGCAVLAGIERSQTQGQQEASFESIHVSREDFLKVFTLGQRFEREFGEIERLTNGFIKVSRFQHVNQKTGQILFNVMCDYAKDFSENTVAV